jgi:TonB family protein
MIVFVLCLAQALLVSAQQPAAAPPPNNVAVPPATYPDSVRGLEQFGRDLLDALKNNDSAHAVTLAQSMVLPDPAAWYRQTYGDFSEKTEVRKYEHDSPLPMSRVLGLFNKAMASGATGIHVKRYENGCDDNDGENTFPILEYRIQKTPLYDLRLYKGEKYYRLWPIAYVDGTFRYVGDVEPWKYFPSQVSAAATDPTPPKTPAQEKEDREVAQIMQAGSQASQIRVGGTVAAAKLISSVKPIYPERARSEHVQGAVQIHTIIGKDGGIENLRIISGYCSLAPAAATAFRQWRYSPTMLQGRTVSVDTTVDLVFALIH